MSYGKIIIDLMDSQNPAIEKDEKRQTKFIQYKDEVLQFNIRFKEAGSMGVVLDYAAISRVNPLLDTQSINQHIDTQAERIQKRITFLQEEFRLIENDHQNKRAQLRSYPPYSDDESRFYFEIVLDEGSKVHFQRYQYSLREKRYRKITSQFTRESFMRLIDELAQAILK